MKKIVILGASGMLGSMVGEYFSGFSSKYEVFLSFRWEDLTLNNSFKFDPTDKRTWLNIPEADFYINCIGIIKPNMSKNIKRSIFINSVFPHVLTDYFDNVIHITTDCVFSGKDGNYNENSTHDALDDYGKSKSLGEPEDCMVLRTSIIGPEKHNHVSLISWVRQQDGKDINGFTNHLWNGITTLQYAKVCEQIIDNALYKEDLYHVISPNTLNKFELVSAIANHYGINVNITPVEASVAVDRTMSTVKDLLRKLSIPTIQEQISELQ